LVFLHVEQVEQRAMVYELRNDCNVRNLRRYAHEHRDVRVSQDGCHHDFILNFSQKVVSDLGVENLFDCHSRAVKHASVDNGETSLANLFVELQVV
jgi:hypothetical protein